MKYLIIALFITSSCSGDARDVYIYENKGMVIQGKKLNPPNEKKYGKYEYFCHDGCGKAYIYSDQNLKVGDTLISTTK